MEKFSLHFATHWSAGAAVLSGKHCAPHHHCEVLLPANICTLVDSENWLWGMLEATSSDAGELGSREGGMAKVTQVVSSNLHKVEGQMSPPPYLGVSWECMAPSSHHWFILCLNTSSNRELTTSWAAQFTFTYFLPLWHYYIRTNSQSLGRWIQW